MTDKVHLSADSK